MIITVKFRKDRTSIHPYHVAHGLYIPTARPEGSCTADGRCELSARERREHVARVLPDETNNNTKKGAGSTPTALKICFVSITIVLVVVIFVREKITPLANVEPLRSIRAAGENEPKQFGFIYRETTKHTLQKGRNDPRPQ